MKINFLDLFSGIGGFSLGLEQAGYKFNYHGFSEIDKYASKQYKRRFPDATELGSITDVQPETDLPSHIDILCGGFPCQAFSIAGKRKGFDDTRGTLFFEIARILRHFRDVGKPIPYFILENVKGLLNHEDGRTFATIYGVLADLDYTIECELLNTRNFSCPQNRERIYIVGRFRGESRPQIFPIGESHQKVSRVFKGRLSEDRLFTNALTARYTGDGAGSYVVENKQTRELKQNQARITNSSPREFNPQEISPALLSRDYKDPKLVITEGLKQIGKIANGDAGRIFDPNGISCTLKAEGGGWGGKTGLYQVENLKIRRLTPTECERLQGFPDGWTEGQSDTQRYKQCGNAVSVPVVRAIAEKLISL